MAESEYMQRTKGKTEPGQKRENADSYAHDLRAQAEWIRSQQEKEAAQQAKWNALTPEEREAEIARRDQERQKHQARQQEEHARYEAEAPARRAEQEKRKAEQEAHAEAQRQAHEEFREGQRREREATEAAEQVKKAAGQAAQHAKDVEELSHYEHDHEKQPGTAVRARLLSSPDAERLSAADTKAHEKRLAEAAALEHAQAANRQAAHQLVVNFRAAIAQAIPSIETAAREARMARKLTPEGTHEILVDVGEVAAQALMSNVQDAGIKAAIRVVCARVERGETVDVLRANLESVAARLDPLLADKAHGKGGEVFGAIPEAAQLAHQLAQAGHAAIAKATGQSVHQAETKGEGGVASPDSASAVMANITNGATGMEHRKDEKTQETLDRAGDAAQQTADGLHHFVGVVQTPWMKAAMAPAILNHLRNGEIGEAATELALQFTPGEAIEAVKFGVEKLGLEIAPHVAARLASVALGLDVAFAGVMWVYEGFKQIQEAHEKGDRDSRIRMYARAFAEGFLRGESADGGIAGAVTPEQREAVMLGLRDGRKTAGGTGLQAKATGKHLLQQYGGEDGAKRAIMDELCKKAGQPGIWSK